jgi:hypothetical protein
MRNWSSTCLARAASAPSLTATPDSFAISMLNGCSQRSPAHSPARSPPAFALAALDPRALLARG